jgi:phage terminase large subunit-like protein
MRDRVNKDKVPYDVWVRDGYMTATEGNVIHYAAIQEQISQLAEIYDIRQIAFDRWGAIQLVQNLGDSGLEVVAFGQGFASMSAPTKELLTLVLAKKFHHGGNPVLRWMADNVVVREDPAGNVKPDKGKSTEKIDGIVAGIMGLSLAIRNESEEPSVYENRGVLSF